jgi:hypothetical protein
MATCNLKERRAQCVFQASRGSALRERERQCKRVWMEGKK